MKHIFLLTVVLAMMAAQAAFASTLAVLEITIPDAPEGEESQEAELTVSETKFLTDELRRQAVELSPKGCNILNRENILALIPPTQEDFSSVVDIGLVIKSDYITNGSINKIGNLLVLSVKLYEVQSGSVIGEFSEEAQDLKGLLEVIRKNSPKLFAKLQSSSATAGKSSGGKAKTSTWVAVGFDILGVAAFGFGAYQHSQRSNHYNDYKRMQMLPEGDKSYSEDAANSSLKKANDATKSRNIGYAIGTALLLSGVGIHVWF